MLYVVIAGLAVATLFAVTSTGANAADDQHPIVLIDTTKGAITVELDHAKAPITVDNFLKYVDAGFYNDTVFHRVIPGFMVQGGGMTADMKEKKTNPPIKNESSNGLSNQRGTLAMARTNDPNSATAQFFINVSDNKNLDSYGGGYAVFGKVTSGMDVVDAIVGVPTTTKAGHQDVPQDPITIKSITRQK